MLLEIYLATLQQLEKRLGKAHPDVADAYNSLVRCLSHKGNPRG
jgi:hypothetical protein